MRYGMVIDLKKCIGCYGCQTACKAEHWTSPGIFWAKVIRQESGNFPHVRLVNLPLLCMQCSHPLCVEVCPTGATARRIENGIVTIKTDECMGCRACMTACPYGARYFSAKARDYFPGQGPFPFMPEHGDQPSAEIGVVQKCDFCLSTTRSEEGREPACVEVCMAKARFFGDLDDPESDLCRLISERKGFQLNAELGTDPSVFYLPDY